MKTGTDAAGLDLNPILTDITAKVIMIPTEAIPGHTTGIIDGQPTNPMKKASHHSSSHSSRSQDKSHTKRN